MNVRKNSYGDMVDAYAKLNAAEEQCRSGFVIEILHKEGAARAISGAARYFTYILYPCLLKLYCCAVSDHFCGSAHNCG